MRRAFDIQLFMCKVLAIAGVNSINQVEDDPEYFKDDYFVGEDPAEVAAELEAAEEVIRLGLPRTQQRPAGEDTGVAIFE
ncbi:hypothetical protein OQA88_9113 [Cercophora sp. LCS_1]